MPTQTTQKNNGEKTRKAEWKRVKLGEICDVTSSKRIYLSEYVDFGVPFYRSKEIINLANNSEVVTELFISNEKYKCIKDKFGVPQKGDILITSVGTLGVVWLVDDRTFYFKDGNLIWFKNFKEDIDSGYLFLLLRSVEVQNSLKQIAIGSSQKAFTIDSIKNFQVEIPPLSEQKKIAEVLSAYDDLIEVNQKKIKTLESLAQTLYKEWFVKPIKDGLPDGWEVKSIRDVYEIKYGKTLPKTEITNNDKYSVYGAGGIIGFYKQKNVDKRTALVTSRGNGSGAVWRTNGEGFVTNNSFTVNPLEDYKYLEFPFIFHSLLGADINSSITGSAQPQITIENINYVQVVIPEKNKIIDFQNMANIYYDQIDNLIFQNQNLQKTRDILLPQLVGGRVEVV